MDSSRYDKRGVSATKSEVHQAIKGLDKGLFEKAFCKILPDHAAGDHDYCNIMHADTAGTKTSLAYIYWKETEDLSVWKGIAQDAIVMNIDDMACVGAVNDIILSSTIGRNKHLITGDVISTLINAGVKFVEKMKDYDVNIHLAGGETADVGDIVRTIDVGYTAFVRMKRSDLIINDIKEGDVIVGFSSAGQASYEDEYNGGMGSNGLTSARHDVLQHIYASKYPESYDPKTSRDLIYSGHKLLNETINIKGQDISVGKLILSPTRTYIPLLKRIFDAHLKQIHGIIHNTGGAQTKVLKFVENKKIIKNNLLEIPPLFEMIQSSSQTPWKEMFQVFNMGTRLEIYTDRRTADNLLKIANEFQIDAQIIGYVEQLNGGEVLELTHNDETYIYS